ncbi:MAG: hypothetical protein ACQKBU_06215 [Verrucomicrobiales bacterium]
MFRSLLAVILTLALVPAASAQGLPGIDIEGPFVRIKRNEDGTRTIFERGNDERTMTKITKTPAGNITLKTIYRMDKNGNPLKCEIFDGLGSKLYKTRFGYSMRPGPTYGKLVQEQLFDTRVKRYKPGTKEEMPVHVFIYRYNPDGTAQLPIGISLVKGKTAEEIFGHKVETQALPDLNELEEAEPANPNARPLGR